MASPSYLYEGGRLNRIVPAGPAGPATHVPVNAPNGVETVIVEGRHYDDLPLYLVPSEPDPSITALSNAHIRYAELQQAYRDASTIKRRIYRLGFDNVDERKNAEVELKEAEGVIANFSAIDGNLRQAIIQRYVNLQQYAEKYLQDFAKYSFIVCEGPEVIQYIIEDGRGIANVQDHQKRLMYLAFGTGESGRLITIPFVRSYDGYHVLKGYYKETPPIAKFENSPNALGFTVTEIINALIASGGKKYSVGPRIKKDASATDLQNIANNKSFLEALTWHEAELKRVEDAQRDAILQAAAEQAAQQAAERAAQQAAEREAQQAARQIAARQIAIEQERQGAQRVAEIVAAAGARRDAPPAAFPPPPLNSWNKKAIIASAIVLIIIIVIIVLASIFSKKNAKKKHFTASMCRSVPQYGYNSQPWGM